MTKIIIKRPDDWHVHLRDGVMMEAVLPYTARQFHRAIIMPNLVNPITTPRLADEYKKRILQSLEANTEYSKFMPLMTCYLTDETSGDIIAEGFKGEYFFAAKLYPANATTNSSMGVTDVKNLVPVFSVMEQLGMPLLIHGEVSDSSIDIFDREYVFIKEILMPLINEFPKLKIVMEHITTKEAVEFVRINRKQVSATITAHHLIINRTNIFDGGINPHKYCLPIPKREVHRLSLREAVTSGDSCFFLGTDTAPHRIGDKESSCGCAGIFSAVNALELYAQVFEEENALNKFEKFASLNGPAFYGLKANEDKVNLSKKKWRVPDLIHISDGSSIIPFKAGETLDWKMGSSNG
tara:strand:- start:1320 stop:2375 length:1056 start_codon:yes stop_codon:yes gene_type:complete